MHVCIEILDSVLFDFALESSLGLCVPGAVAVAVAFAQGTVAVDVHVDKVSMSALQIYDASILKVIATVTKVYSDGTSLSVHGLFE
jgi:hypothetical protein